MGSINSQVYYNTQIIEANANTEMQVYLSLGPHACGLIVVNTITIIRLASDYKLCVDGVYLSLNFE